MSILRPFILLSALALGFAFLCVADRHVRADDLDDAQWRDAKAFGILAEHPAYLPPPTPSVGQRLLEANAAPDIVLEVTSAGNIRLHGKPRIVLTLPVPEGLIPERCKADARGQRAGTTLVCMPDDSLWKALNPP